MGKCVERAQDALAKSSACEGRRGKSRIGQNTRGWVIWTAVGLKVEGDERIVI